MTIPYIIYWLCSVAFLILILRVSYLLSKKKKHRIFDVIGFIIVIALAGSSRLVFPYVYTVSTCNEASKEVLIFPMMTEQGMEMNYGEKVYLLNETSSSLGIFPVIYGYPTEKTIQEHYFETIHAPNSEKEYSFSRIDYFFEPGPASIDSTSSGGEIRYELFCLDEE